MKKLLSIIFLVFAIMTTTVFAADVQGIAEPSVLTAIGEITEAGDGYIIVKTSDDSEVQFNYDSTSYIISADNALPMNISDRKTDKVAVYHSPAMTRSLPPQSHAYAIVGNIENELGNPLYKPVEDVKKVENGIVIITDGGMTEITVPKTAQVSPYITKNIVTLDDITEGSKVLLWYDAVTLSIPSHAYSERVVLLAQGEAEGVLTVNGTEITLKDDEQVYEAEGSKMLPLRTIAEALGYEVLWDNAEQSATVKKADFSAKVVIGSPATARTVQDTVFGTLFGNKTYVAETFFDTLR